MVTLDPDKVVADKSVADTVPATVAVLSVRVSRSVSPVVPIVFPEILITAIYKSSYNKCKPVLRTR